MSHHFDSPTALADGRANLCDVYAFSGPGSVSNLILTVNPDSGRSSATTFRPDALYEFVIASDTSTNPSGAFRMAFTEPDSDGRRHVTVRYAEARQRLTGIDGPSLGSGPTAEVLPLMNGGSAWFGEVGDPFWGRRNRLGAGQPAGYHPGTGNGRGLHDDAFGAALSVPDGSSLGQSISPHPVALEFPYLPTAGRDEMPAFADMFGLRGQVAEVLAG